MVGIKTCMIVCKYDKSLIPKDNTETNVVYLTNFILDIFSKHSLEITRYRF